MHAVFAPLSHWLVATYWDDLQAHRPVTMWLWTAALAFVAVPTAIGTVVGIVAQQKRRMVRMKSGVWLGGA